MCGVIFDPLGNVAKKSTPPPPPPVRGTKGVELVYNAKGLVTVYVTWFNSASGKRESLDHAALIEKVGGGGGGEGGGVGIGAFAIARWQEQYYLHKTYIE